MHITKGKHWSSSEFKENVCTEGPRVQVLEEYISAQRSSKVLGRCAREPMQVNKPGSDSVCFTFFLL